MALFFDADWFDAKLAASHFARPDVARALGVAEHEIALIWKDQRELSARDVTILAMLLGSSASEVAERAGISTPVSQAVPNDRTVLTETIAGMNERLAGIERELADIKALLQDLRSNA
jgi:hypothetical protein